MSRRSRAWRYALGVLAAGLTACGVEFDSIGQLDGLRVLGVENDTPLPKPGETVNLRMVYHDTGDDDGAARDISFFWLAGCENPPNDAYQGCLVLFGEVAAKLGEALSAEATAEEVSELIAELASAGVTFGFGDTFQTQVSADIISQQAGVDAAYGLSFVFFAACAGELRPETTEDGFPVACYDELGERLSARDFVAGYTSMYSYEAQENRRPKIIGMRIAGTEVPRSRLCINEECEALVPDPDRACDSKAPRVSRCQDGAVRQTCPKLDVSVIVDADSVDQDAPLSLGGEAAPEPMWVNYHTDRGSFTSDLSLINDIESGFRSNPETQYLVAETPGPAFIWAAVRDNRGGFAWARTSICVR